MKRDEDGRRLDRLAAWAGLTINAEQEGALRRFGEWMIEEALPAGGIGPAEAPRVWVRHVVESLVFAPAVPRQGSLVDVGTGVGLPAIPLAIVHPAVRFVAVDRSEGRIDLLERAVAVLGIDNVHALCAEVERLPGGYDGLTSRASGAVRLTLDRAARLLRPGAIGLAGLSRRGRVAGRMSHPLLELRVLSVPGELLDGPLTLLRMVRSVEH